MTTPSETSPEGDHALPSEDFEEDVAGVLDHLVQEPLRSPEHDAGRQHAGELQAIGFF